MVRSHSIPSIPITDTADIYGALPKGRYFTFLNEDDILLHQREGYIAQRKIGPLTFIEAKCSHSQDWQLRIGNKRPTFWMAFQLLGECRLSIGQEYKVEHQQYLALFNRKGKLDFEIKGGKASLLLIGLKLKDIEAFAMEWRHLQLHHDIKFKQYSNIHIGYRIKNTLTQIQRTKNTYFSLKLKLASLVVQLIDTYHADLIEQSKSLQQADVSLFHRAKEYIIVHYMDEDISIKQMVSELRTSRRTLFRIFKENGLSINSAIQSIRIYKGREMLRRTDLSVDMIAFQLQFATAKYFIKQYVKYFGHTPAMERQLKQRTSISTQGRKPNELSTKDKTTD
ncbi:helix-turn-helix domain-containing protein [Sphingobacterium yanglingense]|uniref:AraC-like DNA-binding protein n=1 Tax=Sphingobacterium yanglingense TaxID=1437280 RepID=A0A4R6WL69_9SPHI|nr:AraC family transcriptional regulator [Sphingobacterium yanglingense]TDQ76611.1 AraC-like DNA-binding protein [Sphingobacterium yanglingense]